MDPPHRSYASLSLPTARVERAMQAPFTTLSTPKSSAISPNLTPGEKSQGESDVQSNIMLADAHLAQASTSSNMLGQFSFGPATQTTVVTTTTTTTTNFPPLLMKAPHHLHELDSKLYPLAASPTPQSIKRLCFDIEGRPTYFREADDASKSLQALQKQQQALQESGGVLRSVAKFDTKFERPRSEVAASQLASKSELDRTPRIFSTSKKRAASPISISEAARLASQQGARKRRHVTRDGTIPNFEEPATLVQLPANSRLQICQTSTPVTPGPDASGAIKNPKTRPRRSKGIQEPESQTVEPSNLTGLKDARAVSQTLSPSSEVPRNQASQAEDLINGESGIATSLGIRTPWQDADVTESTSSSRTAEDSLEVNFPPIDQAQRRPRPRPSILDTTAAQDLSLPSPSLSPVTAAANLQNRRGYFEGSSLGEASTAASVDYLRSRSNGCTSTQWAGEEPAKAEALTSTIATQELGNLDLSNRPSEPLSMMNIPTMLDSFEAMPAEMKSYVMYQLLRRCPKPVLHFVADVVNPSLKCDFLSLLPVELGLHIVSHLDLRSLCSAAQVSKKWRQIIDSDEKAWKHLFDADGYVLQEGELPRAIREGWGWQHASRPSDWEKDLSATGFSTSDTELSASSAHAGLSNVSGVVTPGSEVTSNQSRRSKRKAPKTKGKSRKQQKRHESNPLSASHIDTDAWMDNMSQAEGPYAAANAAAIAVPCPNVGLPSLKNLHLFKSLYQRHHSIRKSWMQEETRPRHIAFRAHQRHVVTCLQFDTDKILTGSDDTNINVYDTQTGALRARLEGHEGGVWALEYEGNVLVSGSTDRSVRVWDIEKGVCTQVFQGHTSTVRCLQILMPTRIGKTADGRAIMMPKQPLIITGSRDSNLRVWKLPKPGDPKFFQAGPPQDDTDCPYFVRVLNGHHHSVRAIAAHADTLVSGSYDYNVRVWKISTGETLHRLQGHTQKVYSVVLDHKRNRCISGSMDNVVKVWSLDTGSVLYNLEGHHSLVGLLDLHDDRLVSAAADSTLRIWDPETGHCKSILTAHTGAITCFQHDGQKVISGSDRTLKMWNVATGELVKDLLTDLSGVWQVKFNQRRCVAAVQRNNFTYIEVLDFGAARDGVPDHKRGRRIVVNAEGQEVSDPHDAAVDMDVIDD